MNYEKHELSAAHQFLLISTDMDEDSIENIKEHSKYAVAKHLTDNITSRNEFFTQEETYDYAGRKYLTTKIHAYVLSEDDLIGLLNEAHLAGAIAASKGTPPSETLK